MSARLPRELTDISDEIRAVPAPPIPRLDPPFAIRVADPETDAAMISEWMKRPHLARTWRYDRGPGEWHNHLSLQLAGSYSRPLLFYRDGEPYAYIEIFRAAKDHISTVYDADPYDIGFHGAIADADELDTGMARDVAPLIFLSVFASEPQCQRVVFDAEDHNHRARVVMQRWGCVHLGDYAMAANRHVGLYALPRPPETTRQ